MGENVKLELSMSSPHVLTICRFSGKKVGAESIFPDYQARLESPQRSPEEPNQGEKEGPRPEVASPEAASASPDTLFLGG